MDGIISAALVDDSSTFPAVATDVTAVKNTADNKVEEVIDLTADDGNKTFESPPPPHDVKVRVLNSKPVKVRVVDMDKKQVIWILDSDDDE